LQQSTGTDTKRLQNHVREEVVGGLGKVLRQCLGDTEWIVEQIVDGRSDTGRDGNNQEQLDKYEGEVEVLHKQLAFAKCRRTGKTGQEAQE